MALQYSTTLRTAQVAAIQTTGGSSAVLKIFSGSLGANCAASDPSGLLATITLPSTFLSSASGVASLAGTWSTTASGTGSAASFRIYDGSSNCIMQGTVTATGGGGDLTVTNVSIASGQAVSVSSFAITAGNA